MDSTQHDQGPSVASATSTWNLRPSVTEISLEQQQHQELQVQRQHGLHVNPLTTIEDAATKGTRPFFTSTNQYTIQ